MRHHTDSVRPETGSSPEPAWLFRVRGVITRWNWDYGPPRPQEITPWRFPKARALSRHTPALAYLRTTGDHLLVESGLERELAEELDGDPAVTWLASQPCELHFPLCGSKPRRHVPDLLVVREGKVTIWDVRPLDRRSSKFCEVSDWTRKACAAVGWGYELFAGHAPQRRVNQMFVACFRSPSPVLPAYSEAIRQGCLDGSIRTVGDIAERDSGYGQLTSAMWHLIWARQLSCDLERPITGSSPLVWVNDQ